MSERWAYRDRRWVREADEPCADCDQLRTRHGGNVWCVVHFPPLRTCFISGCMEPVPRHRTDAWLCDRHSKP